MEEVTKKANLFNALNECSFGVLYTLFNISQSPLYFVMRKMSEYDNFNTFLGDAMQSDLHSFIPELSQEKGDVQ